MALYFEGWHQQTPAFYPRSGGPKLKGTQAYPSGFCKAVARYHKRWCIEPWCCLVLCVGAGLNNTHLGLGDTSCLLFAQDLKSTPSLPEQLKIKEGPAMEAACLQTKPAVGKACSIIPKACCGI